jgi:hypothetical protein
MSAVNVDYKSINFCKKEGGSTGKYVDGINRGAKINRQTEEYDNK